MNGFQGDYRWLSNFWPAVVVLDGVRYPAVEHAYQASKTLVLELREPFSNPNLTAGMAKRWARNLSLRPDWYSVRVPIMLSLLRQKFAHEELKQKLIETGSLELIEHNTWGDRFWGVYQGRGENTLGKLLMQVRTEVNGTLKNGA